MMLADSRKEVISRPVEAPSSTSAAPRSFLTTHVESFMERLDELQAIFPGHWEELALDKDKTPLDPMWNVYAAREAAGEMLFVTLRQRGRLVGYFSGFVAPGLHYRQCLTLTMDIYYTTPDIRGGTAGLRLMRAVMKEAKRRGVDRVFFGSKLHKDSGRLFEAMGLKPVETFYSAWIGG